MPGSAKNHGYPSPAEVSLPEVGEEDASDREHDSRRKSENERLTRQATNRLEPSHADHDVGPVEAGHQEVDAEEEVGVARLDRR